MIKATNRKS